VNTTQTITVSSISTQPSLVASKNESVILYNTSTIATIYLSNDVSFNIGGPNVVSLRPLAQIVTDGTHNWYAATSGLVGIGLQVMPGSTATASPADIATAIALSGLPLISDSTEVYNATAVTAAAGSSYILPSASTYFSMPFIGYEIWCSIYTNAATASVFEIELDWYDPSSGVLVDLTRTWVYASGQSSLPHQFRIKGPTKAGELQVRINNAWSSTNAVIYSLVVLNNSRVYAVDSAVTVSALGTFPGFTNVATADAPSRVVYMPGTSIAASGGTLTWLLPLFTGLFTIASLTGSGTTDEGITCTAVADQTAAPIYVQLASNALGKIYQQDCIAPFAQSNLIITNNNASARTIGAGIAMAA